MDELLRVALGELVEQATGQPFHAQKSQSCHGGCIHRSAVYSDGQRSYFVKVNELEAEAMFTAEAEGLQVLGVSATLRVPKLIGQGVAGSQAFLVLEALNMGGRPSAETWRQLGEGLAKLHCTTSSNHGWESDNFIGRSPQSNRRHESWGEFFVKERLRPQFVMAQNHGFSFSCPDWEGFLGRAGELLEGYQPESSLLHGDLWSGNVAFSDEGEPLIFDPATYYGDRETDLAFTEFFGGFAPEFYAAYREAWPLQAGYEKRRDLYNLYHVLNHANLFGGGYAAQAESMMRSLIE